MSVTTSINSGNRTPALRERPPLASSQGAGALQPLRRADRIAALCLPSLADAFFALVLFGGLFLFQGSALGSDGDVGWGLRLGQLTLTTGLPRTEPMLRTMLGTPSVSWEWLSQVCYAVAYRLAGLNGVVALAALLIAGTGMLLFRILQRRGAPVLLVCLIAVPAIAILSIDWSARANLFSLPLTLLFSEGVWRYWRGQRRLWLALLPPIVVLWANLHAGFLAGFLLLGAALATALIFPRQRTRARLIDLSLTLCACALATLCTPWGIALQAHMLAFALNPLVAAHTQEFQPLNVHQLAPQFFLLLLAGVVGCWVFAWQPWKPTRTASPAIHRDSAVDPLGIVITLGWTLLAIRYIRFLPLWPLVVLPPAVECLMCAYASSCEAPTVPLAGGKGRRLARSVARLSARMDATDRQLRHGIWTGLSLLLLLLLLATGGMLPGARKPALHAQFDSGVFPVAAAARLRRQGLPAGNGFNTYEWGGYLDFALPEYHVFIDSRSDVYSQSLLQDYLTVMSVRPGWQRILTRYDIAWALLPAREPLAHALEREPTWTCQAEDNAHVAVLCRKHS